MEGEPTAGGRRDPRGRLWPNEEQQLWLQAALAPPPAAVEAWHRIHPVLERDSRDPGSERLLPLVWANIRPDGPAGARLVERHERARQQNERLLGQLREVLRPLHDRAIPTVLLKGMALVASAYRDPATRPMSDIDVLVPLGQVAEATRRIQDAGWRPAAPVTSTMTRLVHSMPFSHAEHPPLDLHWHVFEECCRPADDDDFWAQSVPATIGGVPVRIPAPEDQLLHVCVHGEKWVRIPGVRWIADAVMLIRHTAVRWDRLVAQAVARRFVLRMRAQLTYLRNTWDAPVPPAALSMLEAAPVSWLERFEHRLGVRDRRRPWALVYWCNHVRSAPGGPAAAALTFPVYLQATWRLTSVAQVPGAALGRVLGRAARP
jgi:hypothetical protein